MRQHNDGNDDRRWKAHSRRRDKAPVAYDTNRRHRPNSEEYAPEQNGLASKYLIFEILERGVNLPLPT